ncbi:MAG: DUF1566 domain-containing protein [Crocinitomicaceae bacterium]|nr:DUF1566 domain-containing protein [Crocinitomicaceae bacterium]
MKSVLFFAAFSLSLSFSAQVQVDKIISLEGTDGNRMLTNLEAPVAPTDAANKAYVDAAVAASGGGSITEITDESASTMNFGAAMRYCHDLNQGGHTDWRMPTYAELSSTVSNGAITVPNSSSGNYIYFSDFLYGYNNTILHYIRLSDGVPEGGYYYNAFNQRVRCVR